MFGESVIVRRILLLIMIVTMSSGMVWMLSGSNSDNTDSSDKNLESMQDDNDKDFSEQSGVDLSGTYWGALQILDSELLFPKALVEFNGDNTFVITGEDFSVALLGNDKLRVNDQYPTFDMRLEGTYSNDTSDSTVITISKIGTSFRIVENKEFQSVDTTTSQSLLDGMRSSGIVIPTVSDELPYVIELNYKNSDSKIALTSVTNSSKMLFFQEQ